MSMKSWNFSTRVTPMEQRGNVWREAMDAACLPHGAAPLNDSFEGDAVGIASPTGIEFTCLRATPLTISGSYQNQQAAMWLALMLDGHSTFQDAGRRVAVARGDILYGPCGLDSTLELCADFRLLYVRVPTASLHPGLLERLACGLLSGHAGVPRVLAAMLRAVGEELEHFSVDDIHPIEVALSEFLTSSLAKHHLSNTLADRKRSEHFMRICHSIDQQLSDAELSLKTITEQQRVSSRYVQKLFEDAGTSFTGYVRDRRLERCRRELVSAAYRRMSVSEICFRWGFNDAAHFSRSFRAKFSMTPRECRRVSSVAENA